MQNHQDCQQNIYLFICFDTCFDDTALGVENRVTSVKTFDDQENKGQCRQQKACVVFQPVGSGHHSG